MKSPGLFTAAAAFLLAAGGAAAQETAAQPARNQAPPDLKARVKCYHAYSLLLDGMTSLADKKDKEALAAFQQAAKEDPGQVGRVGRVNS